MSIKQSQSKELTYTLFPITVAGVVLCADHKKPPRTQSIVQILFYFLSFEINGNILRILKLDFCLERYSRQHFAFLTPL